MLINELSPTSPDVIRETEEMQARCVQASYKVISSLENGMSELHVADMFAEELAEEGVTDYWYRFPRGVERMILFGEDRFQDMTSEKYEEKIPREDIILKPGDLVYFDLHPRSQSGYWGNFAASGIYKPQEIDQERVAFIETIQRIQQEGINQLRADMTGKDVYAMFMKLYENEGIHLIDVLGNFGHRMLQGEKTRTIWQDVPYAFLDQKNDLPIEGQIFGIEPGGRHGMFFGRVEDCIYIPQQGTARILGRNLDQPFPVIFPGKKS